MALTMDEWLAIKKAINCIDEASNNIEQAYYNDAEPPHKGHRREIHEAIGLIKSKIEAVIAQSTEKA